MSKQTKYPLTFVEAEQIAKEGGFVKCQRNCLVYQRLKGMWFFFDPDDGEWHRSEQFQEGNVLELIQARWAQVTDDEGTPISPPVHAWELQDYEPGKD